MMHCPTNIKFNKISFKIHYFYIIFLAINNSTLLCYVTIGYLFYHIPGSTKTHQVWQWNRCSLSDVTIKYSFSFFVDGFIFVRFLRCNGRESCIPGLFTLAASACFFDFSFIYLLIVRMYIHIVYIDLSFEIWLQKGGYYLHARVILFCVLFFNFLEHKFAQSIFSWQIVFCRKNIMPRASYLIRDPMYYL